MPRGRFITIEGGEGAGKSTQIKLLKRAFDAASIDIISTREPGGTPGAEQIRELLVQDDAEHWQPSTEALLMMAARNEHVHKIINPALSSGTWVLCDRFFDSTRVYQGIGKRLGDDWLQALYRLLFGNLAPDLTLYLDIDIHKGLKRAKARGDGEGRFEQLDEFFHESVRNGFLSFAESQPERIATISADATIEQVHAAIIDTVNTRFGITLTPEAA